MLWMDTRFSDPRCRTTVEMRAGTKSISVEVNPEVRAGATGFSVEVNMIQVLWTSDQTQAEALYHKLVSAMGGE